MGHFRTCQLPPSSDGRLSRARSPVSQAVNFAPEQQANSNRLNAYLLRHNQMARTAGRQGFVSFVPIVVTPATSVLDDSEDKSKSVETGSELEAAENR